MLSFASLHSTIPTADQPRTPDGLFRPNQCAVSEPTSTSLSPERPFHSRLGFPAMLHTNFVWNCQSTDHPTTRPNRLTFRARRSQSNETGNPYRCVMGILRPAHTARLSRSLRPPSPRQAPRQSRGLLGLLNARIRSLRSKRRCGQRKRLDIRTD